MEHATINLERKKTYSDMLRSYNIFIDGQQVGVIRYGRKCSFQIRPGHHDIFLTISWCSSQHLLLNIVPDEEVNLICHGNNPLFALYNVSANTNDYIKLYRKM